MYGIAHCLFDRDGRMIGCNLPIGTGPLLEQAPAMAQILHITRLTDPPAIGKRENLTIQRLDPLIDDPAPSARVAALVGDAGVGVSVPVLRDCEEHHCRQGIGDE